MGMKMGKVIAGMWWARDKIMGVGGSMDKIVYCVILCLKRSNLSGLLDHF